MCGQGQGKHLREDNLNKEKEADIGIWEKSFPDRNDCMCKGPEVGMSLACWRNGQKAH